MRAKTMRAPATHSPTTSCTIRPLASGDWPVIERLFGANGACGGCWCMWWRADKGGKSWHAAKGETNRQRFKALVEGGAVRGMIAFAGDEPVGWCNFGPRPDFPRLDRSRVLQRAAAGPVWSIACFFVKAGWRGRGVAQALLERASAECFARGAAEVEGYPKAVAADRGSGKAPAAFVWTGLPAMFAKAGFARARRAPGLRPIYVRRAPAS